MSKTSDLHQKQSFCCEYYRNFMEDTTTELPLIKVWSIAINFFKNNINGRLVGYWMLINNFGNESKLLTQRIA